jgi:hypothetical protein
MAQIESWNHGIEQKHWRILYENDTTQQGGFSKICVKIKKKYVIQTHSIFQHVSII